MSNYNVVELLLAEDNAQDAEMTIRALRKAHFLNELIWVKDGVEALDFVRGTGDYADGEPHTSLKLMLLDIKMPRLDGFGVLRELKAAESTRAIPVIMMTSSNQDKDVAESYRIGANGFVTKPVQFNDFTDALARVGMYWLAVNRTT